MSTATKPKYSNTNSGITFRPTDKMRRAKATLMTALQSGQAVQGTLGLLAAGELSRLARQPDVLAWSSEPGFLSWFSDDSEAMSQLAYLRMLAFEAAEAVLQDPDTKSAGAKVALIKSLLSSDIGLPKEKTLTMDDLKAMVQANRQLLLPLLQEDKASDNAE